MKNWTLCLLLGFLIFSCKTNDLLPFDTTQKIKIVKIDVAKFEYQVAFKFITNKKNIGFLLIDKKEKAVLKY